MPDFLSLPAEIILQIVLLTFRHEDERAGGVGRQVSYSQSKPRWREINGVMCANRSMRQFSLQAYFKTLVLRKTSDLTDGIGLFPDLSTWVQ